MPVLQLTKRNIDLLAVGGREQLHWDPTLKGFGLKVTASGLKSYVIQYRVGGRGAKTRRYTIGQHGSPWTPASARAEAERLLTAVRQGTDVQRAKKQREQQARDLAFDSYVKHFVSEYLAEHWPASWKDAEATLLRFAVPVLKDQPLPAIKRGDVRAVLDRVRDKVATRRKLFATLRKLFRWAVSVGDLERNPVEGLEAPPSPEQRDRVLSDEELRDLMTATKQLGPPFGALVRLLVLTGQRVDEWAKASWNEFDRAAREWIIPKGRAKNGVATVVPLSSQVIKELDAIASKEKWSSKGLLFSTTGRTPVSGFSRAKSRLDKLLRELRLASDRPPIEAWRFHDLRRTMATGLQRLGVRFEVTEAILNHVSGARAGVAGVYQRHDWKPEKRAALQAWADQVYSLLAPSERTSNVVELRRA